MRRGKNFAARSEILVPHQSKPLETSKITVDVAIATRTIRNACALATGGISIRDLKVFCHAVTLLIVKSTSPARAKVGKIAAALRKRFDKDGIPI